MLIFTRRQGEKVRIGDDIVITLVEIRSRAETIRIGIDAPRNVPIHRAEVYDRIQNGEDDRKNPNTGSKT